MKKIFLALLVAIIMLGYAGCSNKQESNATLDTFIKAYTDAGITVDANEKPMFSVIGAKDGVIFKVEDQKTAIYEYSSEKELQKAKEDNSYAKDWISNGRFLLESKSEKAINIFKGIK
jgi:predicted outer membrane protein